MYPREPEYSVCSTDIDWNGILEDLINGQVGADVDLQMSLMNPNVFGLDVNSLVTTFYYQGENVGKARLEGVNLEHLAITDFMMNTTFTPSVSAAISMLADYNADKLLFDVVMDIDTGIKVLGHRLFSVQTNYEADGIDPTIPDPLKYCKCK